MTRTMGSAISSDGRLSAYRVLGCVGMAVGLVLPLIAAIGVDAGATTNTVFYVGATGDSAQAVTDCMTPTNVDCTLRDAIDAANLNSTAGSIMFKAGLTSPIKLRPANGPLLLTDDNPLSIMGPGARQLAISGRKKMEVFSIGESVEDATISGLTIEDGIGGSHLSNTDYGGGIWDGSGDTLTIANSVLSDNSADSGGGIFNNGGILIVTNSTFSGNTAVNEGGGLFGNGGTLTVASSNLSDNSASIGGALDSTGELTSVTNSTLSDNKAGYIGGGIWCESLAMTNTTMSGNTSGDNGGAINASERLTVTNSTLSDNEAGLDNASGFGGGIFDSNVGGTVTNSRLSGNTALTEGGGIANWNGTLTVTDSTLSDNSAGLRGGGLSTGGTQTVVDSTLSHNRAGQYGGGVYNDGSLTVTGSTLADNTTAMGGGNFQRCRRWSRHFQQHPFRKHWDHPGRRIRSWRWDQ